MPETSVEAWLAPATLPDPAPARCIFDKQDDGTVPAGTIVAANDWGYLTPNMIKGPDGMVVEPNHWLIVSWLHVGSMNDLPFDPHDLQRWLLKAIPGFAGNSQPPHMIYWLYGKEMCQTIYHAHAHVLVGPDALSAFVARMASRLS